jgi:hypothetical protein
VACGVGGDRWPARRGGGGGTEDSLSECWVDAGHMTASYSDRRVVS